MRLVPLAIVVLLGASAHAERVAEIDMSATIGLVDGQSTYTMADGTKTEVTWLDGRKHGPYRRMAASAAVIEEGEYQYGQRTGEWIQRDAAGSTIGLDHWLLGVRNGVHQRYEYADSKATLVESINYVLGMRHGSALFKDEESGQLVNGSFAWDVRHGTFTSRSTDPITRSTYVCGWDAAGDGTRRPVRDPGACRFQSSIELHAPQPVHRELSNSKRHDKSIAKAICDASKTLGVPVDLDGKPFACPKQSLAKQEQRLKIGNKVYSGDDLIRELGAKGDAYGGATFVYAPQLSKQADPWLKGYGFVRFYADGPVYWRGHDCEVLVDLKAGRVEAANTQLGEIATTKLADSPLRIANEFLASQNQLLGTYSATLVESNDTSAIIELASRANGLTTAKIQIAVEFKDFVQKRATVKLPEGDELRLSFEDPEVTKKYSSRLRRFEKRQAQHLHNKWPEYSSVSAETLQCSGHGR